MTDRTDRTNGADPGPALAALTAAGFDLSGLTEEQHAVLGSLTDQELALLTDLKGRLEEAGPEVQGHAEVAGGALF
ncbi:aroma-sacti cluster domain-containing protein [Kitasatospora griseola]|uniref:aroma-sacti cluster domain-containing protein n=1 Tax=Kitasatospora griseola TaxID=2064 RepID=UPI00380B9528